jgi:hypothetical protein
MSNSLRFGDHTAFHIQVIRLSVAGAAMGMLAYLAGMVVDLSGQAAQTIHLALLAAVLGLAAAPPPRKRLAPAALLAVGVGLLGALGLAALSSSTPRYPWFGVGIYGLSVGIIAGRDLRDARRYLLPLATGVTVALATFVEATFRAKVNFMGYVPALLAEPAYKALFGFLTAVGLVVRQVWVERDPVARAFSEIRPALSGEMLELCQRALVQYRRVQELLRDRRQQGASTDPELIREVEQLVLRILGLGRKWQEVEREAGRTNAGELEARLEELEQKIQQTADAVALKQYTMARDALRTQQRYLQHISRNRERVTAQVHNYLAALERLHLALLNHLGAGAAKLSDEIQPILDGLGDRGAELEFASEAINELEEVQVPAGIHK